MPPSRKVLPYEQGQADRHRGAGRSGKATQAKLLAQHLASQGLPVREVTFPDYASDSSALIKMYLAGQFGSKPDDVNAYAASSFFAVDRYASYKTDWGRFYEEGGVVIADRYTHLQRGAPVLQAPAGAVGGVFALAVRLRVPSAGPARTGQRHLPAGGPGGQPAADDRPLPR